MNTNIDPELARQVSQGALAKTVVQAVMRLRPEEDDKTTVSPERTEQIVQKLLHRVKEKVGSEVKDMTIFRNLGMFVISALPGFVRELMVQPEIAAATANRRPGGSMIPPPISKRVTKITEIGKESARPKKKSNLGR